MNPSLSSLPSPVWLILILVGLSSCAADPVMLRWEEEWVRVQRAARSGSTNDAIRAYQKLARKSLNRLDKDLIALAQARIYARAQRFEDALRVYSNVARTAYRQAERGRALYEIATLAEDNDRLDFAINLYRRLVRTYPEGMPGASSLVRLERLTRTGKERLKSHLRWTFDVYPSLQHTSVADNMVYFAAREAWRRFKARKDPALKRTAIRLVKQLLEKHRNGSHWKDAFWLLSYIRHAEGRYDLEIAAIERLEVRKDTTSLIGSSDHPYFRKGQLRLARIYSERLNRLQDAVAVYNRFLVERPKSRFVDDVLFWRGCVLLRLGRRHEAEASFQKIPEAYKYSKYLKRLDAARQNPKGSVCRPQWFGDES